jgi:hypothetical protein
MRREFDYLYYTYVLHVDNDGFTSNIITAAVVLSPSPLCAGSGDFR